MNLICILSDEHQQKSLGCYGHPFVQTPVMDRLAEQGTKFSTAYSSSPICVPTRGSIATGKYVHETRCWDNSIGYDGKIESWGHVLQKAGHRVDSIGKLHFRSTDDPNGFDHEILPLHLRNGVGSVMYSVKDPLPPSFMKKPSKFVTQIGPGLSDYANYDLNIRDETCRWLREETPKMTDRPWVLFVSFVSPHFPLMVPQEFYDLYPTDQIPTPKGSEDQKTQGHPWFEIARNFKNDDEFFTPETRRIAIASYYGLCTFLDQNIGRVLDTAEECGLNDNTRIMYISDHGENLGTRSVWGKYNLYEEAAAVPLILVGPDVPKGKVVSTPVSHVDMFPTILQGAGLTQELADRDTHGRSLWDIAQEPDDDGRVAFSEYHATGATSAAFMIRKGNYKLLYYVGFEPELFDLDADPEELIDLAQDPHYASVVEEYTAILRAITNPEAVDALAKSDQAAHVVRHGGREAVLAQGDYKGTPPPTGDTNYD